uniref:Uncharacterized protein n=1 Tax=Romanomermis culicivorax TaxID=13658 RepID=A0A915HWZ8_ROMCU
MRKRFQIGIVGRQIAQLTLTVYPLTGVVFTFPSAHVIGKLTRGYFSMQLIDVDGFSLKH